MIYDKTKEVVFSYDSKIIYLTWLLFIYKVHEEEELESRHVSSMAIPC